MSYHELRQETANECSQAAFAYDPACYCEFLFIHGDYPPHRKYLHLAAKYFGLTVRRSMPDGEADRYVTSTWAETGPELLRNLQQRLADLADGSADDSSLLADDYLQAKCSLNIRSAQLSTHSLLHALDYLFARLPAGEVAAFNQQLCRAIDQTQQQALRRVEGGGWIASAPRTTRELPIYPIG